MKTAKEIEYKLRSYLHHREFDVDPISSDKIDEIKKIYDPEIPVNIYELGLIYKLSLIHI